MITSVQDREALAELSVRDRLVRAAGEVIEAVGEDQLTLAQVVRRAGLTTGAVYSNFANREELVIAVYVEQYSGRMWEGVNRLEEVLESDLRGPEFVAAIEQLVVRSDDDHFKVSRWLRIRAVAATQRYPHVMAAVGGLQRDIATRLIEIVTAAQARGDIDPQQDPRAIALLFQQFGFTLVLADLSGDLAPDPAGWVDLVRTMLLPLFAGRIAG